MKKFSLLLLILVLFLMLFTEAISAQEDKPLFTFCGQSGTITMSWKEFSKCKTEITPIDTTARIISFTVSILTVFNHDTTWVDRPNTGNQFDEETKKTLNKLYNTGKIANQLLINEVILSNHKDEAAPKMTINLK